MRCQNKKQNYERIKHFRQNTPDSKIVCTIRSKTTEKMNQESLYFLFVGKGLSSYTLFSKLKISLASAGVAISLLASKAIFLTCSINSTLDFASTPFRR